MFKVRVSDIVLESYRSTNLSHTFLLLQFLLFTISYDDGCGLNPAA